MKRLKTTNVCFIANYSFTYLFDAVAEVLAKENIEAFWLVNNQKLHIYLQEKYGADKVLYLSRKHFTKATSPIADFKLNELIYGDRVLQYEPENGLQFLEHIQQPIYNFIKNNELKVIFGELTWAHEVLIHRMCQQRPELDCTFLNPHCTRIPDNRFAFFTDEQQSKIFEVWQDETCEKALKPQKPEYLKLNDDIIANMSSLKGKFDRAKRFFTNENIDPLDPTMIVNQKWRFQSRSGEEWNRSQYQFIKRTHFDAKILKPYVFVGLHKQPESSVEVFGRYYEDQLQNIKNLWRALPSGWKILVKEHTNAIGDRPPSFYKALKALPNVILIDEHTNSYEIIKNANLVASITGTICYEAALMNIPSVTFAPVFFNKINSCRQITLTDLSNHKLDDIAFDLSFQPDNRLAFSEYLIQNTFDGKFYDPQTTELALEKKNVQKIAFGVLTAVQKLVGVYQYNPVQIN